MFTKVLIATNGSKHTRKAVEGGRPVLPEFAATAEPDAAAFGSRTADAEARTCRIRELIGEEKPEPIVDGARSMSDLEAPLPASMFDKPSHLAPATCMTARQRLSR